MNKNKLHIFLLLSIIWSFSSAQQYTNYSVKNGLPSNHVYRITQDVNGFIWFITDKGMVKFNGSEFKRFTIRDGLPTNDIWNIVTTPNGNVWYFSKSPKIGYIKNDSIYAFPSTKKGEILSPMNRNVIGNDVTFNNSIAHYQLKNNKWKAFDVVDDLFNNKQYKTYLKHKILDRIQFSIEGEKLFFIGKDGNIIKTIKNIKPILEAHTRAQINDSTYLWLSDKMYTVLNLNTYNLKSETFNDAIGIEKSKYVRMHLVNNQVQITGKGFVSVLNTNYRLVKTKYISPQLKDHFSFIDKQENIWIATFTNGVYKSPKSKQNAVYDLIDNKVGTIKKINNKIFATVLDKGFYQYDSVSKHFIPFQKEEKEYAYGVYRIKELNKVYFITNRKISIESNKKKSIWLAPPETSFFNETARQLVYHKGYLYGNFTSGLNKLNSKNLSIEKSYILNGIRTFISFKNDLFIATSNGLKKLENDSIIPIKARSSELNMFYKKPILSLKKIDENFLLIGTDSYGAFITNLDETTLLKETEYLSVNSSFVNGNNIWLATDNGVYHYFKKDKQYLFLHNYTIDDGLLSNNVNSVYVTKGAIIASSNNGVVTIPKKKREVNQLLNIYVSEIMYNNEILNKKVKFTNKSSVNIHISTLDYSENTSLQYKYKLKPIQKEWTTNSSKFIVFSKLEPNKYELHLQSNNINKIYKFEITPLWYQHFLTKIIFSLLFLSFLISIILYVRKVELKKQERKLKAQKKLADFELHALRSQMNPHFVFNSLNAIQYYITKNEIELSEKYLVKFSRLIRMFFDFSREKEISLDKEIKLLKGYLEIEKMRFGEDFYYAFVVDEKLRTHEQTIPTMLLQPIVENSVNHGIFHQKGKGNINIFFNYISNNSFLVKIVDDGVGIEKSKEIQNKSLKNSSEDKGTRSSQVLKERLYLLNQSKEWEVSYTIKDNFPNGTIVQLTFIKNEKDKSYIN